jgi:hypothetical protein
MIEVNLVPDVKQELIKANRVRTVVVSTALLVGAVAIGIVVLLAVYLFLGQTVRSNIAAGQIKEKYDTLSKIQDLNNTLTVQQQLGALTAQHDGKNITSRFFDLLVAINPPAPNQVVFSTARVEADDLTIRLQGQAVNGYIAADVLKKTILGTKFSYRDSSNDTQTIPLTENVSTTELSYGEDSTGKKVLRFTMTFEYDSVFFERTSRDAIIVRPDRQNVTDSYLRLPESLFGDRATDEGEDN